MWKIWRSAKLTLQHTRHRMQRLGALALPMEGIYQHCWDCREQCPAGHNVVPGRGLAIPRKILARHQVSPPCFPRPRTCCLQYHDSAFLRRPILHETVRSVSC